MPALGGPRRVALLGAGQFRPVGATHDGNDSAARGADLTGLVDGKEGTISGWIRVNAANGVNSAVFDTSSGRLRFFRTTANVVRILATNSAGTTLLSMLTTTTVTASSVWRHVYAYWKLDEANHRGLYLDGALDLSGTITFTDGTIDYTAGNSWIGSLSGGSTSRWSGGLAELWFHPVSLGAAGLSYFRTATGKARNLGLTGELPLGFAPILYNTLRPGQAAADFVTNRGTGGGYTLTGTLETEAGPNG